MYIFEANTTCVEECYFIRQTPASPRLLAVDLSLPVPKGMFRTPNPSPPVSRVASPCESPPRCLSPIRYNSPERSHDGTSILMVSHSILMLRHSIPMVRHSILMLRHSIPMVRHSILMLRHSILMLRHSIHMVRHSILIVRHSISLCAMIV